MAFRYAWCILICVAALLAVRRPLRLPARQVVAALSSGALFGAGAISVITAFAYIPVGIAILILFTFPVLTALLQALLSRRQFGAVAISGVFNLIAKIGLNAWLAPLMGVDGIALATSIVLTGSFFLLGGFFLRGPRTAPS